MNTLIEIVSGPLTSKVSREVAEKQLTAHPLFPKSASYAIEEVQGHWVAAFTKEASPAFFDSEGGGDDEGPEKDSPAEEASESPIEEAAEHSEADDSEDGEEKGEKKEKGEKGELAELKELLTTLLTALGIAPHGEDDSIVPGPDAPPGPEDLGPDAGGPPAPPRDKQVVRHERSLKPGEAAPGTTPVGAPAFSSVADNHPWKVAIDQGSKSFRVEEEIGSDITLAAVTQELRALASGTGYEIKQVTEGRTQDGKRTAKALISR